MKKMNRSKTNFVEQTKELIDTGNNLIEMLEDCKKGLPPEKVDALINEIKGLNKELKSAIK